MCVSTRKHVLFWLPEHRGPRKSRLRTWELYFPEKESGMIFKKCAQMREIAFGRVFPNKVSWTLGRFKARAGHFQIKSLGKHQLWTQRKPPGVIKNGSPSEMAVPGIVYIYHNPYRSSSIYTIVLESGVVVCSFLFDCAIVLWTFVWCYCVCCSNVVHRSLFICVFCSWDIVLAPVLSA